MSSGLEITVISVLGGIIVALITLGGGGFFWLASRIERFSRQMNESHQELLGKINETRQDLTEANSETRQDLTEANNETRQDLTRKIDELRKDLTRQMEQMKAEIINALVNHSHPEPGGPPVFNVPPPVARPNPDPARAESEPEPTPADD